MSPGLNGQLQLASQSDSTTTKRPDGTEVTKTDLYAHTVAGVLQDNTAPMRIKEQQIVRAPHRIRMARWSRR